MHTATSEGYGSLHQQLRQNALAIAEELKGEKPSSIDKRSGTARWGRRGSLALETIGEKAGVWCDHQSGEGGDLFALIARELGIDRSAAYDVARSKYLNLPPRRVERVKPTPIKESSRSTSDLALQQWNDAKQTINDTPAQTYLESRRMIIDGDAYRGVLRWHNPSRALIALMTNPETGEQTGVHRTFLDDDARKIDRKMLGAQGVIRVSPDDEVTTGLGLCEGLEDALSIAISGWRPVWAATSAGAIARFPVLGGIECLSIFSDDDGAGRSASDRCRARWEEAGRDTTIIVARGSANE